MLAGVFATPAGATHIDFPEQPGTKNAKGCAAVASNPGAFPVATQHSSPTSQSHVLPLFADACLE
jgi:hypothetical protein